MDINEDYCIIASIEYEYCCPEANPECGEMGEVSASALIEILASGYEICDDLSDWNDYADSLFPNVILCKYMI